MSKIILIDTEENNEIDNFIENKIVKNEINRFLSYISNEYSHLKEIFKEDEIDEDKLSFLTSDDYSYISDITRHWHQGIYYESPIWAKIVLYAYNNKISINNNIFKIRCKLHTLPRELAIVLIINNIYYYEDYMSDLVKQFGYELIDDLIMSASSSHLNFTVEDMLDSNTRINNFDIYRYILSNYYIDKKNPIILRNYSILKGRSNELKNELNDLLYEIGIMRSEIQDFPMLYKLIAEYCYLY